jgi:hypothetical protein
VLTFVVHSPSVPTAASMAEKNGLKTGHVVVVAVSSAAASFAAMYYLMRIRGPQQDAAVEHDTERRGFSAAVSSWFESWPWTLRSASQEAAGQELHVKTVGQWMGGALLCLLKRGVSLSLLAVPYSPECCDDRAREVPHVPCWCDTVSLCCRCGGGGRAPECAGAHKRGHRA